MMLEVFKRDTLLWLAATAAVGLTAVAGSFNVQRMRNTEQDVRTKHETLASLHGLLSDLKDAETGHRGYLLTGQESFLDPFNASETRAWGRLADLERQWTTVPEKLERLDPLKRLVTDKFAEMKQTSDLRDRTGLQAAANVVSAGQGKRIMDDLRGLCEAAAASEMNDLGALGARAHLQYQTAEGTNLAGAVVAVVVLGVTGVLLRRDAKRREKAALALAIEKSATERALGQLDALVRNAPYSIAFLDHELRPVRVNETFAQASRIAVEDHFGRRLPDLLPDISSELVTQYQDVLAGAPPVIGRLVFGDGRVWEVSAFRVPLDNDDSGLGVIGQDVTDKHAAAEQLRESEEKFRAMADGIPQLAWMTRSDGHIFWYNRRWYDYTGTTLEQMEGWGWQSVHDPVELPRVVAKFKAHIASGEPWEDTFPLRRHDGEFRWHLSRATPLKDEAGNVRFWFGTNTDVTDQRRMEEQLRESGERFRQLAEAMPQIVWVARADGGREYYNTRWTEFTGISESDTLGHDLWADALHPDDRQRGLDAWARSVATGEPYQIEYRFRRHDGTYEWFLGRAVPVRDTGGQVVRWLGTCTNIDEQVKTAQVLVEKEAYLRGVLDNSPDCVKVIDLEGRLVEFNAPGLVSMEIDDFTCLRGMVWPELWPEEAQERVREAVRQASGGQVVRFSDWCPTAKGVAKYWDVMVAPIPDASGRVIRLVGVSRDLTKQKLVEDELREAKRFTESVLHSLPGHLAVIEADGRILSVNESWRQFGMANGMPVGFDWTAANYFDSCRAEDYGAKAEAGIRAVATGERGAFEMEYPCHGGGVERYFVLRANRFRGDGPVRLVISHENVTERVVAERQVREAASQLAQLTEGVPLLMWACRPTGECDYLSRQWLDYTGRGLVEQLGFRWLDALHPDDREPTATAWQRAVEAGGGYDVEFRIRRHDGAYRWFAVRGIPLRDQNGTVTRWFGSCTDIDDRVRQESILERLVEERTVALLRSNQELEKFAYIASHDLQEPLRKIQAFGTRLADKFRPAVGEQGKDYIDRMLDSAGRMRRLIEDLLTFSRVTTKATAFTLVDLNSVARDVLSDLDDRLTRSGGHVEVGPLPTLPGDPSQLRQVFQNLIGNALKFVKPDVPPVVTVKAIPFTDLPPDDLPPTTTVGWRITVADNGIGFDPQYAGRIFELFQRLHGRGEFEGTGLGLAIVRKIVERHGATITAHSHPGTGAEFRIDWPLPPAADARSSATPNGE